MRRFSLPASLLLLTLGVASRPGAEQAVEPVDADVNAKIRAEVAAHSQALEITHVLADRFGPRLTGSPNHEQAAAWAVKALAGWGLKNAALEPWNWNHEGWLNEEAWGSIVSPIKDNLVFEVEAWTPSTKGTITAPAVQLAPPAGPTEAELTSYLAPLAARVKGAIVLVESPRVPPFVEVEPDKRMTEESLGRRFGAAPAAPAPRQGGPARGGGGRGRGSAPAGPPRLSPAQVREHLQAFLLKNGAALLLRDAYRRHGQIAAYNAAAAEGVPPANRYDSTKTLPTALLRNEDYGRIARLLADGTAVQLRFRITNRTYPEGRTSYNVIAEIPGSDKAAEVVMLGGHLDSWHSSTGATDNAIGCAVMMDAVRVLQAIGAKPRRTIRVALWSGEEQGLLGSLAYVDQHFGTLEAPKPGFASLDAYWNIDHGTGLVRGALVYGPAESARILGDILAPFKDLGVYGATSTLSRATGGTDSTSFNHAGLPGINAIQDPMEYESHTHHTNLDAYERIVPDDVKKNVIVTASLVYHLATREEKLPRPVN